MAERAEVPPAIVARIRSVCRGLPEADEETAWVGTRWRIRSRTFAHVLMLDAGWPPAYAGAAGVDGPTSLLMVRSAGAELDVLRNAGPPFFAPPWRTDEVGLVLGPDRAEDADWDEIAELITESYCTLAPAQLARSVPRPGRDYTSDDTPDDTPDDADHDHGRPG